MTDPRLNAPLRELFNGISTDVQLLASQTLLLARMEVSAAASKLAWSAAGLLARVLVTVAGAAVLVSALVLISNCPRPASLGRVSTRRGDADRRGSDRRELFRRVDTQRGTGMKET